MSDIQCWLCGMEVGWGTPVCPQCGSALEWTEGDEDDQVASLMPPDWDDDLTEYEWRTGLIRPYVIGAVVIGLLLTGIGLAAGLRWWMVVTGLIILGLGIYGVVTLPGRYR